MIIPEKLYIFLQQQGINFYAGVPDSLLKHFLKFVQDNSLDEQHVIAANEGLAMALASGYHFSTGKIPVVYLQNSGLGNIINPLTSLVDKEMYSVPMILLIGWRGRPGTKDEPQHKKMGRITVSLLQSLEIPFFILDENELTAFENIDKAIQLAIKEQIPVALLAQEEIFEKYDGLISTDRYTLVRNEVIAKIIKELQGSETVICTTGKIGREFYEQNLITSNKIARYFLSVGAMGHANHLALGIKMSSDEKVIVLDGDGALLMHMGSLPTIAHYAKGNFIHIVINNGSHESVGAQPTEGFFADFCGIAIACGFAKATCISTNDELVEWLENGLVSNETQFVEIRVNKISHKNLSRPSGNAISWKTNFMTALNNKL